MTENLRYGPATPVEPATVFDYSQQEGFVRSDRDVQRHGVCRKLQGGTMCPSFRATLRREGQHARPGQRPAAGAGRRAAAARTCAAGGSTKCSTCA